MNVPSITIAGDFVVKAGWMLGPREIAEYELVYFPNGTRTRCLVEGRTYLLDEPCFILTRPFETHQYIFDPEQPTRHLFIHFLMDEKEQPFFLREKISWIPAARASLIPGMLMHMLGLASTKAVQWRARCNRLLHAVLGELEGLIEASQAQEQRQVLPVPIVKALDYIDKHLDKPLTVPEIAQVTGWTHEHFTRIFARHIGMPPSRAIIHRRIERACQLLVQEQWNMKQIAYEVGFRDEHYFSRTFKKIKGISASQYRKQFADPRLQHLAPAYPYTSPYPLNHHFIFSASDKIK